MKLNGSDAIRYFSKPDPRRCGLLIYGPDTMRVALRRQDAVAALVGPNGDEEMRLVRMTGADVRKDPAILLDGIKSQGFFPGPRVVFLEEATDGLAKAVTTALSEWRDGDAVLVVTAGQLAAKSALRKVFEGHNNAYAAGVYTDPPSRDEIEAVLAKAGVTNVGADAMAALVALSREIDPGDFSQTMEKLGLYKIGDPEPVSVEDVAACAPATSDAALDDAIHIIAEARVGEIGPMMKRLEGQGMNPTTICIGATRHFRRLHAGAAHPQGADVGLSGGFPRLFGPRKNRMVRQASALGVYNIERVLGILMDADLGLRSSQPVPARAMLERAFIRIAMLAKQ